MSAVAEPPQSIPIAEGIGIFLGIVGWDVLTAGEVELIKAFVIAAAGALAWYGVRCWRASRDKRH